MGPSGSEVGRKWRVSDLFTESILRRCSHDGNYYIYTGELDRLALWSCSWVHHSKASNTAEGVSCDCRGCPALLQENIVANYNKYQDRGNCPIYAKEYNIFWIFRRLK